MPAPSSPGSARAARLRALAPYALVALAVALAFRSAPFLGFVDYDDPHIVENEALRGGLGLEALRHAFTSTAINLWLPLTLLSHALDFQLYGDWAGGHHLSNVLLHLASCLLLLAWLRRYTGKAFLSLAVALLFAVHPLRAESVAWVAERKDVLSVLFYLLTLWFYSAWAAGEGPGRRRLYLLALVAAALGVLSKPSLMTLPAALLLADFWPLRRLAWSDRRDFAKLRVRLLEKVPFLLLALVAAGVAWATWSGQQSIGEPLDHGLAQRTGFASVAYLSYLGRTFLPWGLAAYVPYPAGLPALAYAGAFALLALLSLAALRWHAGLPWLAFGWFWFLGTILPGSGLVRISDHFAPDRYSYLAHLGLFVAFVWGLAELGRRLGLPRALGAGALALAVAALVFLADRQSRTWKTPETLWRHAIEVTRGNYVAHNQLGIFLLKEGRFDEGVAELRASLAIRPGFPIPAGNLALALARSGDIEQAARLLAEAGPALPERPRFQAELLSAARATGDPADLETAWEGLVAGEPENAALRVAAGDFHYGEGRSEEALRHYRAASRLDPGNARATLSAGTLLLQAGAADEARPFLERAAKSAGTDAERAEAHRTLAQSHLLESAWSEAVAAYAEALRFAPERPLLLNEAAQLLLDCPERSLRDPARALEFASALAPPEGAAPGEVNPRYQRTLARALARNGETARAREAAALGLEAVAAISGLDPLPEPWTPEELKSLREGFAAIAAGLGEEEP